MAEINDLNVTDASNTARFPENQAASSVNNGARALEGIIARWNKDTDGSVASTGSANAYVMAANQTLSAYYDGLTVTFDANFTNTGAATLNVDSVSADSIVWPDGRALVGNEIVSGGKYTVRHDGTNWQLVGGGIQRVPAPETEAATTSGTTSDFTGISANARRVTVFLEGVSISAQADLIIQIGDAGGFETSGYVTTDASTDGYHVANVLAAGSAVSARLVLELTDPANHTWLLIGTYILDGASSGGNAGGHKSLSPGPLTQIRLTTDTGTPTFDAGVWTIRVEE